MGVVTESLTHADAESADGGAPRQEAHARFLFYSHDGLGLGHLRRNLAIAAALTESAPNASVLLATGCNALGTHGLARNVDLLVLPGLRKLGNGRYSARRLPMSGTELRVMRSAQLETAVRSFRPDVMLVDKHPVGVRGELRPALEALLEDGGRVVLGLRDILDDRDTVGREWEAEGVVELIERYVDRVLVYGDPRVLDLVSEYGLPASVALNSRYCGYVVHPDFHRPPPVDALPPFATRPGGRQTVIATAGGGEDGLKLLESFVQAARGAPWDGVVVTGPHMDDSQRHALRRTAVEAGVEFHRTVADVSSWFSHADALVCMGGYNTLSEAVSRGTPTLCVPRAQPRREQLMRARSFARLGLLRVVEPELLDPDHLCRELAVVLATSRSDIAQRARETLGFGGAHRAAAELLRVAKRDGRFVRRGGRQRFAALPHL
jgi:predicted glycosyltransferase